MCMLFLVLSSSVIVAACGCYAWGCSIRIICVRSRDGRHTGADKVSLKRPPQVSSCRRLPSGDSRGGRPGGAATFVSALELMWLMSAATPGVPAISYRANSLT